MYNGGYYGNTKINRSSKYGARKVSWRGQYFDSVKEYTRYLQLRDMLKAGEISELQRQVKYVLIPKQSDENGKLIERECSYKADFVYKDKSGKIHVEDVKGYTGGNAYNLFVIKRKLLLFKYGIQIEEI